MKLLKAIGAILLHKVIKKKAVRKAEEKSKKKFSIDDQFYISLRVNRTSIDLSTGRKDPSTTVNLIKIKSFIKNFGGTNIKTFDSTNDTKIYFNMPRTSVQPMFNDLKKQYSGIQVGEVKENKD
jgi:hypothetical protein